MALYFAIGAVLKLTAGINILIPCLYRVLFNHRCPGCGLTTAFLELIQLHFHQAFTTNPMIFILVPAGIFYVGKDYLNFIKTRF